MTLRARRAPLSPLGTVRSLVGAAAAGVPFPAAIRAALREHDVPEEGLYLAWEIARLSEGVDARERDALLLVALASFVNALQGSTRIPLPAAVLPEGERGYLDRLLAGLGTTAEERAAVTELLAAVSSGRSTAGGVIGVPGGYVPLIVDGDSLYQQRMLHHELRLVDALGARLAAPPIDLIPGAAEAALRAVLSRPPRRNGERLALSDEQGAAVLRALGGSLTVISGGPGTGKTSIVVSIVRALVRLGVPIETVALGAPTGKAANRLDEAIKRSLLAIEDREPVDDAILAGCAEPKTLHRLLGYQPSSGDFQHDEENQLAARVVIVDECSMIDLFLMDRLVRSVRPDARLILLGDADQLPSVDAGAVFRDLLPPDGFAEEDGDARSVPPGAAALPVTSEPGIQPNVAAAGGTAGPGGMTPTVAAAGSGGEQGMAQATVAAAEDGGGAGSTRATVAAGGSTADPRRRAAVRLTRSYRMDPADPAGRAILAFGQLINRGRGDLLASRGEGSGLVAHRSSVAELEFQGVELVGDATTAAREALLDRWHRERVRSLADFERRVRKVYRRGAGGFDAADREDLEALFHHFERFRILCLTRGEGRPTGAAAINARLHQLVLEAARAGGSEVRWRGGPALFPGEPLMMQRNDYDRGLWNGDQGLVLRVAEPGAPHHYMAVFARGQEHVAFHLDSLRSDVVLSFAITVHKGQGSEFDHVALVLPEERLPILTRELLYTAVTRSRRSAVILGDAAVLRAGIDSRLLRYSGIGERLARRGAAS